MKFEELKFVTHELDPNGVRCLVEFDNGYGASIIKTHFSYGGKEGFYELGVLHNGSLVYDTPLTDDVIGWLSERQVEECITKIEALEK